MFRPILRLIPLFSILFLVACGDGDTATLRLTAGGTGGKALVQALSSRQPEDFSSIRLNVVSVRVHVVGDDEGEEGEKKSKGGKWHELLQEEDKPFTLDLLKLLEGELIQLAEGEIPAGKLTQIRFVLDSKNPGHATPAGSDPEDEEAFIRVRVPSGTTSGLKIKGKPIAIEAGTTRDLRMDFDVRASLKDDKDGLRIRPVIQLRGVPTVVEDAD